MSNTYFSFKQFTVHQDRTSMKVCTDACLFGAWSAAKIADLLPDAKRVLDIGAGTGLLSLMISQKSNADIEAVEIESAAAEQAEGNFRLSPWSDRLKITMEDISAKPVTTHFDFIISNPPFYEEDLKSPDKGRNTAMHDTGLTLTVLAACFKKHLSNDGYAAVLLPFFRTGSMESAALRYGLHVVNRVLIRQTPRHNFFRTMLLLSKFSAGPEKEEEICIHDEERNYTEAFTGLLKDYYLNL